MFFSDELIAIGRKSNPKSNISMGDAMKQMHAIMEERIRKSSDKKWMTQFCISSLHCAITTLYKEGYALFNPKNVTITAK